MEEGLMSSSYISIDDIKLREGILDLETAQESSLSVNTKRSPRKLYLFVKKHN